MKMAVKEILVSEVGPRDGLQSIKAIMPTEYKKNWISAMAKAGIAEIEVGSFVPASVFPQLADTAQIARYAKTIKGLQVAALVPNLKGAIAAINAGVDKLSIPFSVSETHSLRNLKRNHQQVIDEVRQISRYISQLPKAQRPHFEASLSTAFGCTIEGTIAESAVLASAEKLIEAGAAEVGLSDTTGYGNPQQVKRLVEQIKACVGNEKLTSVHLHNTRGLGLANALAAIEAGIETIDSSMAGIGGCPFAPGASGNIVTEDLVFMLQSMGIQTGIDLPQLLEVRHILRAAFPSEPLYGFTPDAGIPKGFVAP
jgi:hydroxymethylglutaryl-CoA lyase